MMQQSVTFWIPELLSSERVNSLSEELSLPELPWLSRCLSKADALPIKPGSFYDQASYLFHLSDTLPVAATSAPIELENFSEIESGYFWLKVDPVQLIADRDTLILIPSEDIAISEAESKSLMESFNQHFAEDHVSLQYGDKGSWYLSIAQAVDVQTTSLDSLAYRRLDDAFPKGNASSYWRKLLNEVQMLFFTHPVNKNRRELGQPEINSVWIWGEGKIPEAGSKERTNASIYSDNHYLAGIAKLTHSTCFLEPKNHQGWSSSHQLDSEEKISNGQDSLHDLICLSNLSKSLPNLTEQEWLDTLVEIDKAWFKPLFEDLKLGNITSLLIDVGLPCRYHLTPKNLRRFWRLNKPMNKFTS